MVALGFVYYRFLPDGGIKAFGSFSLIFGYPPPPQPPGDQGPHFRISELGLAQLMNGYERLLKWLLKGEPVSVGIFSCLSFFISLSASS